MNGRVLEVFVAFLKLGLTSFGGPVAHLGYFRAEFVERRQWLDDKHYSDLVALCQFLPGPASSQLGMALGLGRAGWPGALAAWLGFTLPSAFALILFAFGVASSSGLAQSGVVHGLKVMAVAVVTQAVWGMAKSLCPDPLRRGIAIGAALVLLTLPSAFSQFVVILLGGLVGWQALSLQNFPAAEHRDYGVSKAGGRLLLLLFLLLLCGLPVLAVLTDSPMLAAVAGFYQAGSLVFGGGHVVLPLLQSTALSTGWVSNDIFMAGYGATQAVPGPLFSFAAFLGAVMPAPLGGLSGGLIMLLAIFIPSFLLVTGALPYWESLRQRAGIQRSLAGINAAVVGVLGAALYDPVWRSAIHSGADLVFAMAAYALLVFARVSPVLLVLLAAMGGYWLAM